MKWSYIISNSNTAKLAFIPGLLHGRTSVYLKTKAFIVPHRQTVLSGLGPSCRHKQTLDQSIAQ